MKLASYDSLYRRGGFHYEENRDAHVAWIKKHVIEAFKIKPGTLLDAGCGDGFWSGIFQDEGFVVTGMDASKVGIKIAKERYPECDFIVADIDKPLAPLRFDVAFARTIASHFNSDDPDKMPTFIRNLASCSRLVICIIFTTRTKDVVRGARMHGIATIREAAINSGCDLIKLSLLGNYIVLGIKGSGW